MGIVIRTSLLVDRSPDTEGPQQARITLDDGTVLDVRGHSTYWGPRFVVTESNVQGPSLEALTLWEQSKTSAAELNNGWRTFRKDRKQKPLIAEWLRDQIGRAIKQDRHVLRVNSDKAGDDTITRGTRLIAYGLFGYRPVILGCVVSIDPIP